MGRDIEIRLNTTKAEKDLIDQVAYKHYGSVNRYLRALIANDLMNRGYNRADVSLFMRNYVHRDDP